MYEVQFNDGSKVVVVAPGIAKRDICDLPEVESILRLGLIYAINVVEI